MDKYIFDQIFIISLNTSIIKRERCINQLLKYNITNYEFYDANNTVSTNFYNVLYEKIILQFDELFIKQNFQKGALGCLLSHMNVLKEAKERGYKSILILEDDFLMKNNFNEEYLNEVKFIPDNWDFIYFGKKQGTPFKIPEKLKNIYPFDNSDIIQVNDNIYKPNYFTYASHAWCIKDTMFDILIERYNKIDAPVDLMVMNLFDKHNFYVLNNDLFITTLSSDIRENNEKLELIKWKWDINNYFNPSNLQIKNIIVWGFKKSLHTHHYIHNMYYNFFNIYFKDLKINWIPDDKIKNNETFDNTLFFVSPAHGDYSNLPINDTSLYIFHLDNFEDNRGISLDTFNSIEMFEPIIKTNRAIILIAREKITNLSYFDVDYDKNIICLPWFSDKTYNEIMDIKKNITQIYNRNKNNDFLCYFGSVWYLNNNVINELVETCISNEQKLLISGRFANGVKINNTDNKFISTECFFQKKKYLLKTEEDSIERLNKIYGIRSFITIQGEEHYDNYISNRLFEAICGGYIGVSNNIIVKRIFKEVYYNNNISELIKYILNMLDNEEEYCKVLKNQIDDYISKIYGYTNIEQLISLQQRTFLKNNSFFSINNYSNKIYKIIFSNKVVDTYFIVDTIENLDKIITSKNNYIVKENEYDIFMIDKIIKCLDYKIIIDENYKYKKEIVDICLKNNKKYFIKKPIKIYCLFSSQRTGSTLIIDYIQKTSKKILAISEIFSNEYINLNQYDTKNKNGVLYNKKIIKIEHDLTNLDEYIEQFIKIAEDNDFEGVIFKYTFDLIGRPLILDLNILIEKIKQYNIIYLDRNDIDVYISKNLADKNNTYSNNEYKNNLCEKIDIVDFYNYLNKKNDFLNTYLSQLNNVKYINYNFIKENDHLNNIIFINDLLNSFYGTKEEYLKYEKYYERYNIFNKKQNRFSNLEYLKNDN